MKTHYIRFAIALFLATVVGAFAQGTAFTYQGRLNDGTNSANGSYDLRFTIYDLASGGGQQGNALTNLATGVSNGLFIVALDFGNQFSGADRWLEIGVRTNGGGAFATLSPRQQLTSTPYAIQAGNAASAGSVAAGNITGTLGVAQLPSAVVTNGASGVNLTGTFSGNGSTLTSLNASNVSSGILSDARLSTNVALRSGGNTFTGNQTNTGSIYMNNAQGIWAKGTNGISQVFVWPRYSDDVTYLDYGANGFNIRNNGGLASTMFMQNNGNVGIGTNAPQQKLHVNGNTILSGNLSAGGTITGNGSGLSSLNASNVSSGSLPDARLSANVPLLSGGKLSDAVLSTDVARRSSANTFNGNQIVTNGSVGIGTLNPGGNKLQINANFHGADGFALQANQSVYGANIQINRTNGEFGIGLMVDNSGNGDADAHLLLVRNNAAAGANNVLNVLDVRADGNTSLSGNLSAGGTITGNGSGLSSLNASSVSSGTVADARLSSNVALRAGGNTFSGNQTNTGSIFMNNSETISAKNFSGTYEYFLWPRWSDDVTYLNFGANGFAIRNSSSVTRMFMQNDGKVGIGTTTPATALQVIGTVTAGEVKVAGGNFYSAAADAPLRIVRGTVTADGSIYSGTGFTVNHSALGTYVITYTTPFSDTASVVVTGGTGSSVIGNHAFCTVNLTGVLDVPGDFFFRFIAIGER